METAYQELRIFLSSPSDVAEERDIAKKVIDQVRTICKEPLRLNLEAVRWEDLTPMHASEESVQTVINEEIKKCQIFVLILGSRFGTAEPGSNKSNTEREIDIALELQKYNRKIKFLAYFKELANNNDQGDQERQVRDLRKTLSSRKILHFSYDTPESFKEAFTHHLYDTAIRFRHSSHKVRFLNNFWQFGVPERFTNRRLAIFYPPMTFSHLVPKEPETYWLNRVCPQVLYEDMKALEKVEKTLRLINANSFGFYSIDNPPTEINFLNRVWVCQARNKLGAKYHKMLSGKTRFMFRQAKGSGEAKLYWRYGVDGDDYIEIRSPLSKYLTEQRKSLKINGEWTKEMGMVIAKDYAILARIRNDDSEVHMKDGYLYDYYIAGIRGLGTWGAAHFIDRNYKAFENLAPDEDIQLLLEVTYKDNRIFDVKDVSDRPEHYFKNQYNTKFVRKAIREESEYLSN